MKQPPKPLFVAKPARKMRYSLSGCKFGNGTGGIVQTADLPVLSCVKYAFFPTDSHGSGTTCANADNITRCVYPLLANNASASLVTAFLCIIGRQFAVFS